MKKTYQPQAQGSKMGKFFCSIFGHRYVISKRVTTYVKEYRCVHCQEQATTNTYGTLSRLTPRLKEINETLAMIYQKRHARQAQHTAA